MNKKIEIKITKNADIPRYVVCGDDGQIIYGSSKNFDEAKRLKEELEIRIEKIEQAKFVLKRRK